MLRRASCAAAHWPRGLALPSVHNPNIVLWHSADKPCRAHWLSDVLPCTFALLGGCFHVCPNFAISSKPEQRNACKRQCEVVLSVASLKCRLLTAPQGGLIVVSRRRHVPRRVRHAERAPAGGRLAAVRMHLQPVHDALQRQAPGVRHGLPRCCLRGAQPACACIAQALQRSCMACELSTGGEWGNACNRLCVVTAY